MMKNPNKEGSIFSDSNSVELDYIKEHYQIIALKAWETWHQYRKEMDKIIYFGGTLFLAIISITGLFSAFTDKKVAETFGIPHIIFFHLIFFTLFLAYSYKRQITEITFINARCAERYYFDRFKIQLGNEFSYVTVKRKFTKSGRKLLKAFNYCIFGLYLFTTLIPFVHIEIYPIIYINVKWLMIFSLVIFFTLLIFINYLIQKETKKMKIEIIKEWAVHNNRLVKCN